MDEWNIKPKKQESKVCNTGIDKHSTNMLIFVFCYRSNRNIMRLPHRRSWEALSKLDPRPSIILLHRTTCHRRCRCRCQCRCQCRCRCRWARRECLAFVPRAGTVAPRSSALFVAYSTAATNAKEPIGRPILCNVYRKWTYRPFSRLNPYRRLNWHLCVVLIKDISILQTLGASNESVCGGQCTTKEHALQRNVPRGGQ